MITIEFNEKQQAFHFNLGEPENTFGWQSVIKTNNHSQATKIVSYLHKNINMERKDVTVGEIKKILSDKNIVRIINYE